MGFFNTFKPTAAFSFEFLKRNANGKYGANITPELFFLMPPEEYTMNEGYRVSVNKTIDGGFVNDFGNDFKAVVLSGSIYAYWFGTVQSTTSGTPLEQLERLVGAVIPGDKQLSGIEEFFKLRYILSRFRDSPGYFGRSPKSGIDKGFVKGLEDLASGGDTRYKDVAIIYHDYDDNNHLEVVIDRFDIRKSKDDPFTWNYSISMTGVKTYDKADFNAGSVFSRERPYDVMRDFQNSLTAYVSYAQDVLDSLKNVPTALMAVMSEPARLFEYVNQFANRQISSFADINAAAQDFSNHFADVWEWALPTLNKADVSKYADFVGEIRDVDEACTDKYAAMQPVFLYAGSLAGVQRFFGFLDDSVAFDPTQTLSEEQFFGTQDQKTELLNKNKRYYRVCRGDTPRSIAVRFFGDHSKSDAICRVNGLTPAQFENNGMVGSTIVIASEDAAFQRFLTENMVYSDKVENASPEQSAVMLLGTDLSLTSERDFLVDGTGDLGIDSGDSCYQENLLDRYKFPAGSLNPIHPNWGIEMSPGDIPTDIVYQKTVENLETQAGLDPRTFGVSVVDGTVTLDADTVRAKITLRPHGGDERTVTV